MTDIFVFGSNLQGRHGKGAALHAFKNHGAIFGQGRGLHGNSYAIPTKLTPYISLPLIEINRYVAHFLFHAMCTPDNIYNVTAIGCGLAGYKPKDIAPMFHLALTLSNIQLPSEFLDLIQI